MLKKHLYVTYKRFIIAVITGQGNRLFRTRSWSIDFVRKVSLQGKEEFCAADLRKEKML